MPNPVKERLLRGDRALGLSFGFACAPLVEVGALLGFDFTYLDAEHGTISPRECEDLVRAADCRQSPTICRVGTSDPQVMLRYLDTGIAGIQLPHMRTAADVERAVRAVRFHPDGERGLAGGRWADFGLRDPLPRSVARSNDELLLIAQIEDLDAVERLDELVAVPGVDVWFVGPSDLSQAAGLPGQQDHPEVRALVEGTIKKLRDKEKIVGSAAAQPEAANRYFELGVQYVQINVPRLFVAGAQAFLRGVSQPKEA
jgi:4-hydroxy-2-oxoheptanedioate aldolase